MTSGDAVRVHAPAKINLGLRVGARRADGYHELRTIFQSIELYDTLTFLARPGPFELRPLHGAQAPFCVSGEEDLPLDSTNLIYEAAAALWRAIGESVDLHDLAVTIEKRIPPRAGLGGGSSDAAATLGALAHMWHVDLEARALHDLAAGLGADVPYFLVGGTAAGTGRGEVVQPLGDGPERWLVIARPEFGVSTAAAYSWLGEQRAEGPVLAGLPAELDSLVNDLESPVMSRYPALASLKRGLLGAGASGAAMSGSGSAVFGLFATRDAASVAARAVSGPGCSSLVTRTVGRDAYSRLVEPTVAPLLAGKPANRLK